MSITRRARLVVAMAALGAAAAVAGFLAVHDDSKSVAPRASSAPSAPSARPSGLVTYRIVYRVEQYSRQDAMPVVSTLVVEVLRPDRAFQVTKSGPPPGGAIADGLVLRAGLFDLSMRNGVLRAELVQPEAAIAPPMDLRGTYALDVGVRMGLAERLGVETVAGRDCALFRTGEPLGSTPLRNPDGHIEVTSCVDRETGLVLRETLLSEAKPVSVRTAVSFGPASGENPLAGVPQSRTTANYSSEPSAVSTSRGWYVDPSPPPGFREQDARVVLKRAFGTGQPESLTRRFLFTDGVDVVTVAETQAGPSVDLLPGRVVDLGTLGRGRLVPTGAGLVVDLRLQGRPVTVVGSLSEDAMLSYVRNLRVSLPSKEPVG